MTIRRLAAVALTVMLASPASLYATDVYKWIDANGVPNFSERPPEGVDYIKLDMRVAGPASSNQPKTPLNAWRKATPPSPAQATDKVAAEPAAAKP